MKRDRPRNNSDDLLPKIETLPGAVCAQWKQCGKPNCKCANGLLHGPYYYRFWYEFGQQRKTYVKKADVLSVKVACDTRRREQRQARQDWDEALRTLRLMKSRLYHLLSEGGL